jgi:uncharacterized protein YndB with AHSA1/START domain
VSASAEKFAEVLRLNRQFKAPREAVFRAFTDPAALVKWYGPEGMNVDNLKVDLRPGGAYSLTFQPADGAGHNLSGTYREVSPPGRLVMTWVWGQGDMAGVETLVTIDLAESGVGAGAETELTLTHEKLPSQNSIDHHGKGWISIFKCLDRFVEEGGLFEPPGD